VKKRGVDIMVLISLLDDMEKNINSHSDPSHSLWTWKRRRLKRARGIEMKIIFFMENL